MKLVVDTNRIIAALVRDSVSRKILLMDNFEFLTVEITKSEIEEHKQELLEKVNIIEEGFNTLLSLLFKRIFIVSDILIESKMDEARGNNGQN